MHFQLNIPTRVLFGSGQLNRLSNEPFPGRKALLVISNGNSARNNGALARTQAQLKQGGVDYVLFDQIEPNPLASTVMNGAAAARAASCDFVVALGGGSVMDAAKAICAMATNPGEVWDYMDGGTGKANPLTQAPLPLIAITTTAGTGSEVDAWGVITNDKTHEKMGFGGIDGLFPVLAVVDPELMRSVSPLFTAFQGFDALFHSTECYISKSSNPMSDMVALTAMEHIASHLPTAVADGACLDAREHVAFGNTLSGMAMTLSSCTSEHSMEHAMSAYHQELPHGAGLIMISHAYYAYFIDKHACDEKFIRMAQALGMGQARNPADFLTALERLQAECSVANLKMSDYSIIPSEFPTLADNARTTMGGLFLSDPCEMTRDDCIAIYNESYQ